MDTVLPEPAAPTTRPFAPVLGRVRRWIPRSLLVALLGIGLSSWLIPAFTRQWDDRQKAGDLKAALVADMATATGRALLDAETFTYASAAPGRDPVPDPASIRAWSVAALEIRAKLEAYFGHDAVDAWSVVTGYVDATLSRAYRSNAQDAVIPLRRFAAPFAGNLQRLYSEFYDGNYTKINELASALLGQEEGVAESILLMDVRGYSTTWHDLVSDLLPTV